MPPRPAWTFLIELLAMGEPDPAKAGSAVLSASTAVNARKLTDKDRTMRDGKKCS